MQKSLPLWPAILTLLLGCQSAEKPAYPSPVASVSPLLPTSLSTPERRNQSGGVRSASRQPKIEIAVSAADEKLDSLPTPVQPIYAVISYPIGFLMAGIPGEATVRLQLEKDGTVSQVLPVSASAKEFADTVAAKIQKCTFTVPRRNGEAVSCGVLCKITFSTFED